jgi:hypothetical protein
MDVSRLTTGQKIAGVAGLLLLIIMFIFDWFTVDVGEGAFQVSAGGNAWETMEFIRFIVLLTAIAGIALAVMAATQSQVNTPVAISAIAAGLGILSVILIAYRIIDPPGGDVEGFGVEVGRGLGVFLGLVAAAGVAYGGWTAMQEEGTSFGAQADRLGDGPGAGPGAGSPPPPPPPPASGGPAV